jgi:hypothetical protein
MDRRHRLLIPDATLRDFAGHSFFYDTTVATAAEKYFAFVQIYAHPDFFNQCASGSLKALRLPPGYRMLERANSLTNADFIAKFQSFSISDKLHAALKHAVKLVVTLFYLWDVMRKDLSVTDRTVVFLQYVTLAELSAVKILLRAVKVFRGDVLHFAIVLRYSPERFAPTKTEQNLVGDLLSDNRVSLFTDSEQLTHAYRANFRTEKVVTLPIPVLPAFTSIIRHRENKVCRIGFLGATRKEKGFGTIPAVIRAVCDAQLHNDKTLNFVVQVNPGAPPMLASVIAELEAMVLSPPSPNVRIELLSGPLNSDLYVETLQGLDVMLIPYEVEKYQHSTSGIFAECIVAGVPCVCLERTWAAEVIFDAQSSGLRIGEVVDSVEKISTAVLRVLGEHKTYRDGLAQYAEIWKSQNTADVIASLLWAAC